MKTTLTIADINTAVATDSSGIGFAIPIDIAKPIMDQAIKGEALDETVVLIAGGLDKHLINECRLTLKSTHGTIAQCRLALPVGDFLGLLPSLAIAQFASQA